MSPERFAYAHCVSLYLAKGGRRWLTVAVREQVGFEAKDFVAARKRTQTKLECISQIVNSLLDNITPHNRVYVDKRLDELRQHS